MSHMSFCLIASAGFNEDKIDVKIRLIFSSFDFDSLL